MVSNREALSAVTIKIKLAHTAFNLNAWLRTRHGNTEHGP